MNLVIDIGNTRAKIAVFENESMIESRVAEGEVSGLLTSICNEFGNIEQCIVSSVKSDVEGLIGILNELGIQCTILTHTLDFPFNIQYHTPNTLGNDRLAAVAGAYSMHPGKDVLVIDAGTAITFDLLTKKEGYVGGTISPGLNMRFAALHNFTDKLPLESAKEYSNLIGQTTSEAIINGVQNGLIFEIESYLTKFSNNYPQITVLLTGGDAQFFDNKLKRAIFVVPNLTLLGLNLILNYNAQAF